MRIADWNRGKNHSSDGGNFHGIQAILGQILTETPYELKNSTTNFSPYFKARILYYGSQNFKNIFLDTFKVGPRTDFWLKVSKKFYDPFWLRVVPF